MCQEAQSECCHAAAAAAAAALLLLAAAAAAWRAPSPRRASAESATMRPFPRPAQRRGALRPPRPATGSRRPTRPRRATDVGSPTAARAPAVRARRCRPAARHPVGGHVFEYFTTRKHALSRRTVSRVSPLSRACWVALTSGDLRPLSRRTVRLPHTRHGSRSPVITVAAAQRARGARDGGAEQRPLASGRCSVGQPETRALPLHVRLLPCPVTRRALARPPHRARSARLLAASAARPAPPRLPPPCLTREER